MTTEKPTTGLRWTAAVFAIAAIAAAVFIALREWPRIEALHDAGFGAAAWLTEMQLDSTPFAVLFCLLPAFLLMRKPLFHLPRRLVKLFSRDSEALRRGALLSEDSESRLNGAHRVRAIVLGVVVGGTSLAASLHVAFQPVRAGNATYRLWQLPPAYQDEFSYLFQARTFLDGRWSYPGHPTQPRLFDSMHIYNEGRVASRYFPGTGGWMAPFVAIGRPLWGHWLAGMLIAMFVFAAGRELGGDGVGFLAGMLTAVAPGMALFSNLLLAHHPTLLGLSLFLWMFQRLLRTDRWWNAALAGLGLSFAMLCRPMTAFGFGLPFGITFVFFLCRRSRFRTDDQIATVRRSSRIALLAAIGFPILLGFLIIGIQNRAITGDWLKTPYGEFTRTYTPRHIFGFNNGERAEAMVAAGEARTNDVFVRYDKWAVNLTPRLAMENVENRLLASARWTLGIVPLLMAAVVFLLHRHHDEPRWWLVAAAIVSVQAVHVPYWFVGMLDYHYVFETGPLLLLVFARSTQLLWLHWNASRRPLMPLWWGLAAATALLTAYFPLPPFWTSPRIDRPLTEIAFSKRQYLAANQFLRKQIPDEDRPALVLIEPDEAQFHFEYITNDPDLSRQAIVRARYRPGRTSITDVLRAFPERTVYSWNMKTGEFRQLRKPSS
jgi:Dolichyl-phosphate-mannose-protein mannosyltransferase